MKVHDLPPDPSTSQRDLWWRFVIESDGADPDGWWLGHCPLHDKRGAGVEPTAQFNFQHGALRCMGDPRCHPRRSMSLNNVLAEMARADA
jgi:hypothetical protein